ncbi:hypothetical protein ES703_00875 [subsurface metagenome]|nr:S8 family serine peptidase [bacterium]
MTVSALNKSGSPASYVIAKPYTNVAAPGGDDYGETEIYSTIDGGEYDWMSGTSMAAPHATGLAGLMLDLNPDLKPYIQR